MAPCSWESQTEQGAAVLKMHKVVTQGQGDTQQEPHAPSLNSERNNFLVLSTANCVRVCKQVRISDTVQNIFLQRP